MYFFVILFQSYCYIQYLLPNTGIFKTLVLLIFLPPCTFSLSITSFLASCHVCPLAHSFCLSLPSFWMLNYILSHLYACIQHYKIESVYERELWHLPFWVLSYSLRQFTWYVTFISLPTINWLCTFGMNLIWSLLMYDLLDVVLGSICKYFDKHFCIMMHELLHVLGKFGL